MAHSTAASTTALLAAATALSAAGFLTVPPIARADPTCTQYGISGKFQVEQDNGFWAMVVPNSGNQQNFNGDEAASGAKNSELAGADATKGVVNGGISGRHLDFTIHWDGGAQGHYTGDVGTDDVAHGSTVDVAHPGSGASWDSIGNSLVCITPAAAQPAPVAPAPAPPQLPFNRLPRGGQ
jgi:hypothetical protein